MPEFSKEKIQAGLGKGQFFLLYQPRFDLYRQAAVCAEALVRWDHPELGVVSPIKFIEPAEKLGLIEALGEWVLGAALETLSSWHSRGFKIEVSVNVSPEQLTSDFPNMVRSGLEKNRLLPHFLELEITESVLISPDMRQVIEEIMSLGVGISIDDFGTGHSSLAYLRHFNAKSLKVDGSFLHDTPGDLNGCMLLNSIIRLGHGLGMKVVCEGAETHEQIELIELAQADQVQGYAISRPISEEDLISNFHNPELSKLAG